MFSAVSVSVFNRRIKDEEPFKYRIGTGSLPLELKIEGVPCESSISKMVGKTRGMFPNWTFTDTTDIMETNRRINVGKCFIAAVRKRR